MYLTIKELLDFTSEERDRWDRWFQSNGDAMLAMPVIGAHSTVGRLIVHTFGLELHIVESLRGDRFSNDTTLPAATVDAVFGYGLKARRTLRDFIAALSADDWNRTVEFAAAHTTIRKLVLHALIHEVRHWAQVSRIMTERGFAPPDDADFLLSRSLD